MITAGFLVWQWNEVLLSLQSSALFLEREREQLYISIRKRFLFSDEISWLC